MHFHIQLLDTDVAALYRGAQKLRRILSLQGVDASVEEVSCFLEITRRGYMKKLPVLLLNGQCMCSGYHLSAELLADFCKTLKEYGETQSVESLQSP